MPSVCSIVDVHGILHNVVREIIGFAPVDASANTTTGQEHAKAPRVMIAAVIPRHKITLSVNSAAEFTSPQNQRVIEQLALLQIPNPVVELPSLHRTT